MDYIGLGTPENMNEWITKKFEEERAKGNPEAFKTDNYLGKMADERIQRKANNAQVSQDAGAGNTYKAQVLKGGFASLGNEKEDYDIQTARVITDPNYSGNRTAIQSSQRNVEARPIQSMTAAQSQAAQSQAANVDMGQANAARGLALDSRGQQQSLAAQLSAAAAGQGPSAAQAQLQAGTDAALSASMALANSARGGNRSVALKNALMQQGTTMQQAANSAAQLRAQEQQAAQQSLGAVLSNVRGQDLQLQSQDLGASQAQAQLQQQTALANAANAQQTNLANASNQQDANKTNLLSAVDQQKQKDTLVQQYLAMGLSLDQANMQAQIQQEQFNVGQINQGIAAAHGISQQNSAQGLQIVGGLAGAAGAFMGNFGSDRKLKTGIKKADPKVQELMDALSAYSYEYREPEKHGHGERLGIMAQDLEKSSLGKALVTVVNGARHVDIPKSVGAALAALANLNSRVKQLEAA